MDIKINPEFKHLIPPLTPEEYQGLEDSIRKEGCRDAIIIWNGVIVDGHNRFEICQKIGISPSVKEITFASEDEAKIWIIQNQFSRRNINHAARCELALTLQELMKPMAKDKQKEAGGDKKSQKAKNAFDEKVKSDTAINTRKEAAKAAGVGENTLFKYEALKNKANIDLMDKVRNGEIKIHPAYDEMIKKEKAAVPPVLKTCIRCSKEKDLSEFYTGKNTCRECVSEYKKSSNLKDFKGVTYQVSKEVNAIAEDLKEEILNSLDENREIIKTPIHLIEDLESVTNSYTRNIRRCASDYNVIISENERKKIIAILMEAETAIQTLKGVFML